MNRVVLSDIRLGEKRAGHSGPVIRLILFGLFLAAAGLAYARLWSPNLLFGPAHWPEALFLLLATATTLGWVAGQVPGQNMMLAGVVVAVVGGAAHTLDAMTGVPFGPCEFSEKIGERLFEPLPWAIPLVWLVAILNARGVSRLMLRPWRKGRNYGLWLIGLAVVLVVLFELSLEPFAAKVQGYWSWKTTKLPLDWYTAPLVNFLAWGLVAGLILAFITPALINKSPVKPAPSFQPLFVWLLVTGLFAAAEARHQLWPAVWLTLGTDALAVLFVVVGTRSVVR